MTIIPFPVQTVMAKLSHHGELTEEQMKALWHITIRMMEVFKSSTAWQAQEKRECSPLHENPGRKKATE